ncbi:transmembrane protein, putative (macronuclear) [Tetrahymena thermophila SB210]|uniref:Transmembrane protein, putative n=1 Tax=Tetrahymena thermophila (strain SB210) TaxID=312017 RepID=Q23E08_TETTS|nr:transmembrane protein, putative [Tetrahymena thermophila SB210]EAR94779.2 transmembrane protein, putative [Tetrahymena thermophila SB210]|eukprot:XP_001015024.2 transmembrane protein, putative [Tetrahymena thermophila SB210]
MKVQFLIVLTAYLLILTSAFDDNCAFRIDQLNNKVLKTVIIKDCKKCFTSDVTLTIESNSEQITSLKLTAVESSSSVQSVTLLPMSDSLTIDPSLQLYYPSPSGYTFSNFITACRTKQINGQLTYDLTFMPKVNGKDQTFILNNGYTSSLLLKSVAYVSMIICIVLFF